MADTYITKINNTAIAASQVVPDSPLAQALAALDMGAFKVVDVDPDTAEPDVDDPSPKVIYLTKSDAAGLTDPYTEWICIIDSTASPATIQWEIIGTTSIDLTGYKTKQTAKTDPSASGNATSFIASITQNENGEITATKSTVPNASTSTKGIVQLAGSIGATVSSENNKAATEKAVRDAIDALDVTAVTVGADKTISSISETNGKISATPVSIQIAESQVTNLTADLASKASTATVVTDVSYDTTNKKFTQTIGGTTEDIVTLGTLSADLGLGTAAFKDVPETGNATTAQVVMGNDTRLTDSRTPKAHATTATTYGIGTETNYGHVKLSNAALNANSTNTDGVACGTGHTHSQYLTSDSITGKEDVSNKVSTWSSTTTDDHYPSEKLVKDALDAKQGTLAFDGTYNATSNKAATVSSVTSRIADLDATVTSTDGTNVQVKVTEVDGKITAVNITTDNTINANAITGKADKVTGATNGNFAGLDGNGNLTDSGVTSGDFATSAQGAKADSAIQGVKVNGTALTPDNNKYVNISAATTAAYGVVILTTQSI